MNDTKDLLKFAKILKDISNEAFKELGWDSKKIPFKKH